MPTGPNTPSEDPAQKAFLDFAPIKAARQIVLLLRSPRFHHVAVGLLKLFPWLVGIVAPVARFRYGEWADVHTVIYVVAIYYALFAVWLVVWAYYRSGGAGRRDALWGHDAMAFSFILAGVVVMATGLTRNFEFEPALKAHDAKTREMRIENELHQHEFERMNRIESALAVGTASRINRASRAAEPDSAPKAAP